MTMYGCARVSVLSQKGFTLIELSIVLVIIGLIIGGVLVGQDLINAAAIRAQITQIEKYNTAVNTFRGKYGDQLPGDMPAASAAQFGFATRGLLNIGGLIAGDGDGNGIIEGATAINPALGYYPSGGETQLFWSDLSNAGLIDFQFPTNYNDASPSGTFFPPAKIGNNNFVYVWSGGYGIDEGTGSGGSGGSSISATRPGNGINYFGLSGVRSLGFNPAMALSVSQAYAIDSKVDDGFPQSGKVLAMCPQTFATGNVIWAINTGLFNSGPYVQTPTPSTQGTTQTCFDNSTTAPNGNVANGNTNGAPQHYSNEIQNGNNINCALSFQFQ